MANLFFIPNNIITGENAIRLSMDHITAFGKKALIVTDEAMVKFGNVKKLTDELDGVGIAYEIYPGINSEPTHSMIDAGAVIYKESGCDFLIGIGGGSPLDSMKAIAVVAANGGRITEYAGKKIEKDSPPTVAIPTTAGTGSEATKVSIITNTDTDVKMLLSDAKLMAKLAVVDPVFTLTVPPSVTAATGIDALTHAVEAFTSVKAFPMSDIFAESAVVKIFENIQACYTDGSNLSARQQMATAALEAGIAFSNASVTIVHGMSRPIGALFHVAHGQSNAMLLNVCLKFLKQGAVPQLCRLANGIGVYQDGMMPEEGADAFVNATLALLKTLDVKPIQAFGVSEEDFFRLIPKMADDALASGSPGNTRRVPTKDDLMGLYKELWSEGL
ncbi:MAG: iron-containing alcohol dehydrogenase [Clostridiales Family XIII bacterium]|jgi:alcohol dehydrogenase class IV|nr:iron-containing alcohol dehydrogenase [Clostridiales Family XIII bacterium]